MAGSDLTRADLTNANLKGANLTDCIFNWGWLVNTDLRNAVLDDVQFEGARLVKTTIANSRRFVLGPLHRPMIEDVDISVEGEGRKLASGIDALHVVQRK